MVTILRKTFTGRTCFGKDGKKVLGQISPFLEPLILLVVGTLPRPLLCLCVAQPEQEVAYPMPVEEPVIPLVRIAHQALVTGPDTTVFALGQVDSALRVEMTELQRLFRHGGQGLGRPQGWLERFRGDGPYSQAAA